jgi:hypothetical protein
MNRSRRELEVASSELLCQVECTALEREARATTLVTTILQDTMKLRIRIDDDETRALWETAKKAKAEVEAWPAWKHNEVPRAFSDARPRVWPRETWNTDADVGRPATRAASLSEMMCKWCGAAIWRWAQQARDEVAGIPWNECKRILREGAQKVVRRKGPHAE